MDLSTATPAQRDSITHLDGELFIAAGAGSGKTFTLQNRIAYALSEESGPALASVDEVLAITFMEKAAAEIKARVRSALREEGKLAEALKVDAAWISTIHGMCARILREHAFEAGIDPAFKVLSEFEERQLRQEAIESVLRAEQERIAAGGAGSGDYARLFAEFGVAARGRGEATVLSMLEALLAKVASFSDGLDAAVLCACVPEPGSIARRLLQVYEEALDYGSLLRNPKKSQVRLEEALGICDECRDGLEGYLLEGDGSAEQLAQVMGTLSAIRKDAFGRDEAAKEVALSVSVELDRALRNLNARLAEPHAHALLMLARQVEHAYQAMLDERAALDNNGLLHRTRALLLDKGNGIAAKYQAKFTLVMVDEFQDTNQMQVDLIELVAGAGKMCMVGDAQQSIYRFNGADVSVFEARRNRVRADVDAGGRSLLTQLDDNFRSDADVLAFVERVCSQERVFGQEFLALKAGRKGAEGRYRGKGPRINLQLVEYAGSKAASGAVEAEAAGIAGRFAKLREDGHEASEMVVLMGTTSNVDVYAAALRERGFECVVGGGRSFFAFEEVQVVRNLLTALANPADSEALFSVLASPMMHLSADDFLALGTKEHDGRLVCRRLNEGVFAAPGEGCSDALAFALKLFERGFARVKRQDPSQVVMGMIVDSGWLGRLEAQGAQGTSVAANILKAVRMIEELERKPGYGLARVARDFRAMAATQADSPASLSVADQNAVRLMTVHKSKGLEFPIVAVANYEPWERCSDVFSCTVLDGRVYVAVSAKASKVLSASGKDLTNRLEADALHDPREAKDAAEFALAVRKYDWLAEVAEAQRKFYVACTRASEYLLVSGLVKAPKPEDPLPAYASAPILDDVRSALAGAFSDFPEDATGLPYGGSEPAGFVRVRVRADDDADEESSEPAGNDARPTAFGVPELVDEAPLAFAAVSLRSGVFSYSSIAPQEDHLPVEQRDDLSGAAPMAERAAFALPDLGEEAEELAFAPSATDVGSAFHRVGQLAALRYGSRAATGLELPPKASVDAVARSYRIEGAVRERLDAALERWFASDVARAVEGFERVRAEVPFMVPVDFGLCEEGRLEELRFLEGEIDLLAEDAAGSRALVIDYKTGGSPEETSERLQEKHRLQATCYAYALLSSQGYSQVDFAFVRVEQEDAAALGQPQVVRYSFVTADLPALRSAITGAYAQSDLA